MKKGTSFTQMLSRIYELRAEQDYDEALSHVEEAQKHLPGNPCLAVIWADLIQLQENPKHSLDEAKEALKRAVQFDDQSPMSSIELAHFLDFVEDNPKAAAKQFERAVRLASRALATALLGYAQVLRELNREWEATRCFVNFLLVANLDSAREKPHAETVPVAMKYPGNRILTYNVPAQFADAVEDFILAAEPAAAE